MSKIISHLNSEQKSAGKKGNLIAKIFHPVFLFFYLQLLYYFLHPSEFQWTDLLFSILFTIAIPIVSIYFISDDIYLNDRKKRTLPLFITATVYFVFYWVSGIFSIPYFLKLYLLSLSVGLFLLFLINFKFKISLHASGIGSFIPFIFFLITQTENIAFSGILSGFTLLAAYLVLRQRLISKSHVLTEVLSGFLLGLTISIIVYLSNDLLL